MKQNDYTMKQNEYEEIISSSMSNFDIEQYFLKYLNTKPNIVYLGKDYGNKMQSLDDAFKGYDHAVLHVPTVSSTTGHWQIILKDKKRDKYFFFDSYGKSFNYLIGVIFERYGNNAWDINKHFNLGKMIKDSGKKFYVNTKRFQGGGSNNESCGYHCMAVYACFKGLILSNEEFSFSKYVQILDNYVKCDEKLDSYDKAVVEIFSTKNK